MTKKNYIKPEMVEETGYGSLTYFMSPMSPITGEAGNQTPPDDGEWGGNAKRRGSSGFYNSYEDEYSDFSRTSLYQKY